MNRYVRHLMLNLKTVTSLVFSVAAVATFAATDVAPSVKHPNPATASVVRNQISFARAFVGGQDVVHVTLSDSRKTPFMEVKACDLLISYTYDMKGRLTDRRIWFDNLPQASACKLMP